MERLNRLIEQYSRWYELKTYTDRIDAYVQSDFSLALENAKSLLESICKEICKIKGIEIETNPSINQILKKAFVAIGYPSSGSVTQISSALATIGQQMGNLRNEVGKTAHGGTLDELRERNNKIDDLTRELLIDTTEIVAVFLIRNLENENPLRSIDSISKVLFIDNPQFNEYWDDAFGEFQMGDYSYSASEILYQTDNEAYMTELRMYKENSS